MAGLLLIGGAFDLAPIAESYVNDLVGMSRDEVADLAVAFNDMSERLAKSQELEEQLRRQQRLSALGEVAVGIAHEVRNPLASIGLDAEMLGEELQSGSAIDRKEAGDLVAAIGAEVDRLRVLTDGYLSRARPEQGDVAPFAHHPPVDRRRLAPGGLRLGLEMRADGRLLFGEDAAQGQHATRRDRVEQVVRVDAEHVADDVRQDDVGRTGQLEAFLQAGVMEGRGLVGQAVLGAVGEADAHGLRVAVETRYATAA